MKGIGKIKKSGLPQRKVSDLMGIDFSTTATKVVRLKKEKNKISLLGMRVFPPVDMNFPPRRQEFSKILSTHYACLAYTAPSSVVRMVNAVLPEEEESLPDEKLRELLNVDSSFRVSANLLKRGAGRKESNLLAAAIPQNDVRFFLNMFPAGPPAPASLEVSGLSFLSAFLHARGAQSAGEALCLLELGESVSYFIFMNKGVVLLVGKFAVGGALLREKVAKDLGVDEELADTILSDQSINISATLQGVMSPFLKQLSISKDFIERHQGCRISKAYVSGGCALIPHLSTVLGQELQSEVVLWNPLEKIRYERGAIPKTLAGQGSRFAAAIGAAIGGLLQ